MNKLKVFCLYPFAKKYEVKIIDDDLDAFYKEIETDPIDIVTRVIGKERYSIICDDVGYFKEKKKPSMITFHGNRCFEVIINNIIIAKPNGENLESLTDYDIENIKINLMNIDDDLIIQSVI